MLTFTRLFEDAIDDRYKQDIAKAEKDYNDVRKSEHVGKYTPWFLSRGSKKTAEAKYDYNEAIKHAEDRRKASKLGFITHHDHDEDKFQTVKASNLAKRIIKKSTEVKNNASQHVQPEEKVSILKKLTRHLSDHPLPYIGLAAGLASIVALQKRKKRLPEPGEY